MAKAEAKPASSKGKAPAEPKKAPPPEEVEDELDDLDEDEDEDETDLEEEGDDEEDEEEDEEVAPAKAAEKAPVRAAAPLAKAPPSPENDGTWWVPHAVLAAIVLIGVFGFFGAFNSLVGPLYRKTLPAPSASAPAATAPSAAAPPAATPPPARTLVRPGAAASANAADPTFGAKRIVVRYKGAKNSKQERSKEDAKKRAEEALKKITAGSKFEDVAGEFSDEESAKTTGGNLGNFKRGTYDPAIIQTVEKLEVGKTSGVFESAEGFEIVTRTK
jgi:NIMA-interacting peptidyl-prolyl cis-trans isomerase 1